VERSTGFARLGDTKIAYQVMGTGPIDLVMTPGSFVGLDIADDDPMVALFYRRLASIARLIRFDRRGTGSSDPAPVDAKPIEGFMDETIAVMDNLGCERAAILGGYDAGPMAITLASTRPERVTALIVVNSTARWTRDDDYPIGMDPEAAEQIISMLVATWGSEAAAALAVPSRASDPGFVTWFAKLQRLSISPAEAAAYTRAMLTADVRALLPSITAPTLVIHRRDIQFIPLSHAEYLTENIPGARLVTIPGRDVPMMWEGQEEMLEAVEDFLTDARPVSRANRAVATVVFMDIVESTKRAEALGDRRWQALLEVHDEIVAKAIAAGSGRLVKTTGDGFLATFDGPGKAIIAAGQICRDLKPLGVMTRTGIHTGEVEVGRDDVTGLAVHLASRIMDTAGPGEIWVSGTVKDLVVGSGFTFDDRGSHALKGLDDDWRLFSVVTG
jgi:class 3 adenylate cyclase